MLLILEIILTVKAWKNGWKALALLPLGLALGVGFVIGAAMAVSGGSMEDYWGFCLLGDLAAIAVLGCMCRRASRRSPVESSPRPLVAEMPAEDRTVCNGIGTRSASVTSSHPAIPSRT